MLIYVARVFRMFKLYKSYKRKQANVLIELLVTVSYFDSALLIKESRLFILVL